MRSKVTLQQRHRPWGKYIIVYETNDYWVKIITVNAGEALSLQYHNHRSEYWTALSPGLVGIINGNRFELEPSIRYDIQKQVIHRISNPTDNAIDLVEIATGAPDELDIVRINDKYGRSQ